MVTPMTAIPVLLHMEVEPQTVEFQSSEFDMRVRGSRTTASLTLGWWHLCVMRALQHVYNNVDLSVKVSNSFFLHLNQTIVESNNSRTIVETIVESRMLHVS